MKNPHQCLCVTVLKRTRQHALSLGHYPPSLGYEQRTISAGIHDGCHAVNRATRFEYVHVLLIHSFWHPRGGDTTSLALQRASLEARGHVVVPFGTRHPDNLPELGDAGWPGWTDPQLRQRSPLLAARTLWSRHAARALTRALEAAASRGQPAFSVAHVHHLHRHLTPAVLPVLRRFGIPVVWTLHDYELTCPTANHYRDARPCFACASSPTLAPALRNACTRSGAGTGLSRLTEAAALVAEKQLHRALYTEGDVAAYIAPSRFLAERVGGHLNGARIVHLPNAVPVLPMPGDGGAHPANALPRSGVLFAGRMVEEKGVLDVVEMARRMPHVQFTLYGDGPLLRAASTLPNVVAPGSVSREQVQAGLERAAVVLVPSRWPENDPYAVTEAQAAGAVVLASEVGGIPEQITDGADGLLAAPGQPDAWVHHLHDLLENPARALEIGKQARARITLERDPENAAIAMEALYKSVVRAPSGATSRRSPP
jgi:glycosyltransferase involved in cell wall biosynthesis